MFLKFNCKFLTDITSYNVIGQITGTEKHDEIIVAEELGMHWIKPGWGGTDIEPLEDYGTITIGLIPDTQKYFDIPHTKIDVLEQVNPRELEFGAIAMTILSYILAQEGI